jgi:hypothetical protein
MVDRILIIGLIDPTVAGTGGDTLLGGSLQQPAWVVNGIVNSNICIV